GFPLHRERDPEGSPLLVSALLAANITESRTTSITRRGSRPSLRSATVRKRSARRASSSQPVSSSATLAPGAGFLRARTRLALCLALLSLQRPRRRSTRGFIRSEQAACRAPVQ